MKFSKNFEHDFEFYTNSLNEFNFCGTLNPKHVAIPDVNGVDAKTAFYYIDSEGKNKGCREPELLNRLLLTKASVNFQIKQWAEGRLDGTLPLAEFSKMLAKKVRPNDDFSSIKTLAWVNFKPVYYEDIQTQYSLPDWVVLAVQAQFERDFINKYKANV